MWVSGSRNDYDAQITKGLAMSSNEIRFDDGAAYERYMGVWSQRVGEVFLDWLAPRPGLRWLDVGCGNGAFTELIAARCAPASMHGIDPSLPQLEFARRRAALRAAEFRAGDAMALPYAAASFDVAVMPLVIFFVPDAQLGVQEMARVVARGGWVAAYAWDMHGGGFPYFALQTEMRALGLAVPTPPSPESSRLEVMREHWSRAGLEQIELHEISVERSFAGIDEYWEIVQGGPSVAGQLKSLSGDALARLKSRMQQVLPMDAAGRISYHARAHAVKGRVGA
jgi:ubiquinone/menaquinone biosynthesis C-methylase UbiE